MWGPKEKCQCVWGPNEKCQCAIQVGSQGPKERYVWGDPQKGVRWWFPGVQVSTMLKLFEVKPFCRWSAVCYGSKMLSFSVNSHANESAQIPGNPANEWMSDVHHVLSSTDKLSSCGLMPTASFMGAFHLIRGKFIKFPQLDSQHFPSTLAIFTVGFFIYCNMCYFVISTPNTWQALGLCSPLLKPVGDPLRVTCNMIYTHRVKVKIHISRLKILRREY